MRSLATRVSKGSETGLVADSRQLLPIRFKSLRGRRDAVLALLMLYNVMGGGGVGGGGLGNESPLFESKPYRNKKLMWLAPGISQDVTFRACIF